MSNIIEKSAIDTVTDQFSIYGEYVGLSRHIPYVMDGLKPSYRRLIQTAYEIANCKKVKTATLVGQCIGHLHMHGEASLIPVVTQLVRAGIFEGQGNFGFEGLLDSYGAAAPRYTEACLSENWSRLLSPLMKFIPSFSNEIGFKEFEYLPTPIPIGLLFGYLGIAIGTGCKIPEFNPRSILEAYKNDDPTLLKTNSGLEILNKDGLISLWTTGTGRLKFKIKTYVYGDKCYVEGNKGRAKFRFDKLLEWKDNARVMIQDESTTIPKISFTKSPRVQYPSQEEINEEVDNCSRWSESYYLRVVANNVVRNVSLRNWIDITYNNYIRLFNKYKNSEIDKLNFDILTYTYFRKVADDIINGNMSYEDIASKHDIPIEVVNVVSSRKIGTLRDYDPSFMIKSCENKITEFKKMNDEKFIEDVISNM